MWLLGRYSSKCKLKHILFCQTLFYCVNKQLREELKYSYNKFQCSQQCVKMSLKHSYKLKQHLNIFKTKAKILEEC